MIKLAPIIKLAKKFNLRIIESYSESVSVAGPTNQSNYNAIIWSEGSVKYVLDGKETYLEGNQSSVETALNKVFAEISKMTDVDVYGLWVSPEIGEVQDETALKAVIDQKYPSSAEDEKLLESSGYSYSGNPLKEFFEVRGNTSINSFVLNKLQVLLKNKGISSYQIKLGPKNAYSSTLYYKLDLIPDPEAKAGKLLKVNYMILPQEVTKGGDNSTLLYGGNSYTLLTKNTRFELNSLVGNKLKGYKTFNGSFEYSDAKDFVDNTEGYLNKLGISNDNGDSEVAIAESLDSLNAKFKSIKEPKKGWMFSACYAALENEIKSGKNISGYKLADIKTAMNKLEGWDLFETLVSIDSGRKILDLAFNIAKLNLGYENN